MSEPVKNSFDYCIILGDNLGMLMGIERPLRADGNSILCYYFKDRDNKLCAFPLATTYYENGDYTITEPFAVRKVIHIDNNFENQFIEVKNAALDKVFADRISAVNRRYVINPQNVAASFMQQMGFPLDCVNEYLDDGTVYLYDGFYREKITESNHPEIKAVIDSINGEVYAVIPEHFEKTYCYLFWNAEKHPELITPRTNDNSFGKTSFVRCVLDDKLDTFPHVGIMTNAGGVWSIPTKVALMPEYIRMCKNN